jgi:hypothetical protein
MWRNHARLIRAAAAGCLIVAATACNQASPAGPTPPASTPAANQPPQISAAVVTPALAIEDVTTVTLRADVTDPDGDPVSLKMLGCPFGQEIPLTLTNGVATISFKSTRLCTSTLTIAAADGRGGSAQTSVPFAHTAMRGPFRLVVGDRFYDSPFFYLMLEQTGGLVTGTVRDHRDHTGLVDPQEPGTIDAAGRFRFRLKIQSEGDLVVTGQITSAELNLFADVVAATGTVIDGLHAGRTFKLWREAQY